MKGIYNWDTTFKISFGHCQDDIPPGYHGSQLDARDVYKFIYLFSSNIIFDHVVYLCGVWKHNNMTDIFPTVH